MDVQAAIETQRLRLLRLLAGMLAVVAFVSAAPISRGFSRWVVEGVAAILPRAELAAQYLLFAQAGARAARANGPVDRRRLLDHALRDRPGDGNRITLSSLRHRLEVLRALLEDLPGFGLRLLRRVRKAMLRGSRPHHPHPCAKADMTMPLDAWRLAGARIDRPPDKALLLR